MKRRLMYLTVLLIIPALVGLALLGGASSSVDRITQVSAAIVNLDEPATLASGQTLPAGRQLVANLTADPVDAKNSGASGSRTVRGAGDSVGDSGSELALNWSVVSAKTAAAGLADGTYYGVVTIPKNFSASVVDVLQGASTQAPQVAVESAPSSPIIGTVTDEVVRSAARELGTTLTVSYLDQSLTATTTLAEGIQGAAKGAGELADGTKQATDGATSLADGSKDLANGMGQLKDGSGQLASGVGQLSGGSTELVGGLTQLKGGSRDLAGGLTQLDSGSSSLASGLTQLNDGSTSLAGGLTQLKSGSSSLVGGLTQLGDGTNQLAAGATSLSSGIASYTDGVASAAVGAGSLADGATSLSRGVAAYTGGVQQVHDALTAPQQGSSVSLQQGAQSVAAGVSQLNSQLSGMDVSGLAAMPEQLHAASDGAQSISDTAKGDLSSYIAGCQAGSAQACEAAQKVAQGISQGASALSTQLSTGADDAQGAASQLNALAQSKEQLGQLAAGAQGVSDGIGAVAQTMDSQLLGSTAKELNDGAAQLASGAGSLSQGLDTLSGNSGALVSGSSQLASGAKEVNGGAKSAAAGASSLASGASSAADGASALSQGTASAADGASTLASGVSSAAAGASTLASGASSAADGASALAQGAANAADGASTLASGTANAADGASALADGAAQLKDGSVKLSDGASTLAGGLDDAASKIPSYTDEQAKGMSEALGSPVGTHSDGSAAVSTRTAFASWASAAALWLGALAAVVALGSLNRRRIEEAATPLRLTLESVWPSAAIGALQSLLLGLVLAISGAKLEHPLATFGILLVAGVALAVVQQALLAAFGRRRGVILSLLLFAVQFVSMGVILPKQTQSGFFALVADIMPMPQAAAALNGSIAGAAAQTGTSMTVLVVWGVVSLVAAVLAVKKHRQTSLKALREAVAAK